MEKKSDFILEIGTEEIPARFLLPLFEEIKAKTERSLKENRLLFEKIECFGTMRRIVLGIYSLNEKQLDAELKIKGPSKKHSLNEDGSFSQVALSFAKSKGVNEKDLFFEKVNEVEYLFAIKKEKGRMIKELFNEVIPQIIYSIYLPISMKWGSGEYSFIRPVHYITAFYGGKLVNLKLFGLKSSNYSRAHKFLFNNKKIKFFGKSIGDYKVFLKKFGVLPNFEERKNIIAEQAKAIQKSEKLDEDLLNENANLVENPILLKGFYRKDFCNSIPNEVIYSVIKKQQKCFPSKSGNLFFIVADGRSNGEISQGYEQVVNARLSDAKFFYEEDIKIPLSDFIDKTKKIIFLEKAGSLFDKTLRLKSLVAYIAEQLNFAENKDKLIRATQLAKFDLSTHLVGEFPDLSGIMGRYYSLLSGEDPIVADAIKEQYLPGFFGDKVPDSMFGAILGIADRIDSISSCFAAGIIPSGSEDPYGLRRAALGIISIILFKDIKISLSDLIDESLSLLKSDDSNDLAQKIKDFILQRFKMVLENDGLEKDIADSILTVADILPEAYCKAFAIKSVRDKEWFDKILLASDRVKRICKGYRGSIDKSLFLEKEEKELYDFFILKQKDFNEKTLKRDFVSSLKVLSEFADILNTFFDKVLVMHEDEKIKNNRLALLSQILSLFEAYADFSKILVLEKTKNENE